MNEVAGAGDERFQALGLRRGPSRAARGLDRVDVVMIRARMIRVRRHHPLERRDDRVGAIFSLPLLVVEPPRPQVHQAFGVERADVGVVREPLHGIGHRLRIDALARKLIAFGFFDVALREGVDERLFHRAAVRGASLRRGQVRVSLGDAIGRRRIVDVGPERKRHAPVRHRRLVVEGSSTRKRPEGFLVIEAV